jgi:small subunit ribosomal protein S4e
MTRGPKKHLKRLHAPKHWMLDKMGGVFAPKTSPGPHKERESIPLCIILRNRLKYALTGREAMMIAMRKLIKVDGKVRTDAKFPVGFMDVVSIEKSGDAFRLMFDVKGRFVLHRLSDEEAKFKLCRVVKQTFTKKAVPYIVTHDGRTIRYHDPAIKVLDTIKLDIETGKVIDIIKFEVGNLVMSVKGRNTGRVGTLVSRDKHPGSFDILHVRDQRGLTFATRLSNVFPIGRTGEESLISLPKGAGLSYTILEERARAKLDHDA